MLMPICARCRNGWPSDAYTKKGWQCKRRTFCISFVTFSPRLRSSLSRRMLLLSSCLLRRQQTASGSFFFRFFEDPFCGGATNRAPAKGEGEGIGLVRSKQVGPPPRSSPPPSPLPSRHLHRLHPSTAVTDQQSPRLQDGCPRPSRGKAVATMWIRRSVPVSSLLSSPVAIKGGRWACLRKRMTRMASHTRRCSCRILGTKSRRWLTP